MKTYSNNKKAKKRDKRTQGGFGDAQHPSDDLSDIGRRPGDADRAGLSANDFGAETRAERRPGDSDRAGRMQGDFGDMTRSVEGSVRVGRMQGDSGDAARTSGDFDRMGRRPDARKAPRRRKKRRKKRFFLKLLLTIAILVGAYFLATSDLFAIKHVQIEDNSYYTKEQVQEMSGITFGHNLFKTHMGTVQKQLEKDPYIESVKVTRKLPGTVVITVKERQECFVVKQGAQFAILDWNGMVLRIAEEAPALTIVENLTVTAAKPGAALKVTENGLLNETIEFLKGVEESGLYFKRVIASNIAVRAYIYDSFICKGTYKNIREGMAQLKVVIADLQAQGIERGTVIVSGNGTCTFTPEEDIGPPPKSGDETSGAAIDTSGGDGGGSSGTGSDGAGGATGETSGETN